ncbi:MAG: hypothetical protein R3F31_27240 [Verrucomicrobiales bacterium]
MDLIPDYIDRKKAAPVQYLHKLLEEVKAVVLYGVLIYQEQVQRAANVLAAIRHRVDMLRRAMGKKSPEEMPSNAPFSSKAAPG